ncbi:MAG: hypothetical protein ACI35R_00080 [Bacillus sp. (in: firmicutes)]
MRIFSMAFIIASLLLLAGCSYLNANTITMQKHLKGKNYMYIAYKEKLDEKIVSHVASILDESEWTEKEMDIDRRADYIFYFNQRKSGEKIKVYSLWLIDDSEIIIKEKKKFTALTEEQAKSFYDVISSIEE